MGVQERRAGGACVQAAGGCGQRASSVRTTYSYNNSTNSSTVEPASLMSLLSVPLIKSRYLCTGSDYMAKSPSAFFINHYHFDLMAWNNI